MLGSSPSDRKKSEIKVIKKLLNKVKKIKHSVWADQQKIFHIKSSYPSFYLNIHIIISVSSVLLGSKSWKCSGRTSSTHIGFPSVSYLTTFDERFISKHLLSAGCLPFSKKRRNIIIAGKSMKSQQRLFKIICNVDVALFKILKNTKILAPHSMVTMIQQVQSHQCRPKWNV